MSTPLWSLKGKKILVIDDFAEMRSTLRGMLESYDATDITMASTGEEAIKLISNNRFDIILCDYNLGDGKDGQQVLEEAKLRGKLPYASIFIMITAETTSFMVMGALEHQPDDYLSKPFTRTVLQSRIKKQMEKKNDLTKLSNALEQDNKTLAIQLCDEQLNNSSGNRNELLKLKTELLIAEQQLDTASGICEQVINERNLPWANLCLGKIRYLQQDYDNARSLFETIIEENPAYVSAYDWLAKVQLKQGQTQEAQQTIEQAIEQSGKSVQRQRMLAQIAEANQDFATAESARRRSIRNAKNSILRSANDYNKLAEALGKNGNSKDAFKAIEMVRVDFKDDEEAQIAATLSKSKVFHDIGKEEESKTLIAEAAEQLKNSHCQLNEELALELTETFLANGDEESAQSVVTQLVTNNHDNPELLDKVNQLYSHSEKADETAELMESVRKEITAINNNGVKLVEAGNYEEAIRLFEQALERGPDNQALNINSAQAYLMLIKAKGRDETLLEKARVCLAKTANNAELQQRYKILNAAYWKFANSST